MNMPHNRNTNCRCGVYLLLSNILNMKMKIMNLMRTQTGRVANEDVRSWRNFFESKKSFNSEIFRPSLNHSKKTGNIKSTRIISESIQIKRI